MKKNHRVVFGSYVEAHDDPNITNNMAPRTHKCIAIRPTGNIQRTQKVFFLNSGRVSKRIKITPTIASYQNIKIV